MCCSPISAPLKRLIALLYIDKRSSTPQTLHHALMHPCITFLDLFCVPNSRFLTFQFCISFLFLSVKSFVTNSKRPNQHDVLPSIRKLFLSPDGLRIAFQIECDFDWLVTLFAQTAYNKLEIFVYPCGIHSILILRSAVQGTRYQQRLLIGRTVPLSSIFGG